MINTGISLSILFVLNLFSALSFAQSRSSILLSNHTFSEENSEIGDLNIHPVEQQAHFKLKGEHASLFKIKNNKLSIKAKYIRPEVKWYDIEIQAHTSHGLISQSFRLVNDQFMRNRVIAHRGAWKNTGATENSIAALQHAIRLGCQGSEFDVHMSADSALLINHDPSIQGIRIDATPSAELTRLRLANGENMPTLRAYLQEGLEQNNTKLVLEIKPATGKERALQLTQRVVQLVKEMKAQAWIDYISFDYNICLEIIRLDPYARVAYLNGDKSPAVLAADRLWGLDYHFSVLIKNESWIAEAKSKGLTVNAWTVNDPDMLKWFLNKKIDFITTNEPELLLKIIQDQK